MEETEVTITINGTTKTYTKDKAIKVFNKLLEEHEGQFNDKTKKICYVLAWLKTDVTEINADRYYY